jgi:alpha-mannosidase
MRRAELALREAELWGIAARTLRGFDFTPATLADAWHKVLLNQFHDILPGSCIERVKLEAEADLAEALSTAQAAAQKAAAALLEGPGGFTIFNSLPWARRDLVDIGGQQIEVTVPPCGWTSVQPADSATLPGTIGPDCSLRPAADGSYLLDNGLLRAQVNARGEVTSLVDSATGRQFMAGPGNQFRLFKDVPDFWDAWDIASMAEQQPIDLPEPVTVEILQSGPLVASLRLTRKLHTSTLSQVISLRRGSSRLEFATSIDWREDHKLLKVAFPCAIHSDEVISEIQFGHLRRPTHRSHVFDADRFEVCNHKWSALAEESAGLAVLNDCKYGLSALGNTISLTLLKSPLAPDPTADRGPQTFTYALYPWTGSLAESGVAEHPAGLGGVAEHPAGLGGVVREAYELNVPLLALPGHAAERSLFSLDAPNVVIETVKPAEDGSKAVVLRLYESMRSATRCTLTTSLPLQKAFLADMMEDPLGELECVSGKIHLEFRPFEIKTVILQ